MSITKGFFVGESDGVTEGFLVGDSDGVAEGFLVGDPDDFSVLLGGSDGFMEGL